MLLYDLFGGLDLFNQHLKAGIINEMRHPYYPDLAIYNYGHKAQHDNIWDVVTEQCRGLVVNRRNGTIVARPFKKFFNLNTSFRPETMEKNLPYGDPEVYEKVDGSLGILYNYCPDPWHHAPEPAIATRGSFYSDQAKWATEWYKKRWRNEDNFFSGNQMMSWPEGYTPLFEIIYKENRIVVNYDFEGLVLLGFVNIETGFELPYEDVVKYAKQNGFRYVKKYNFGLFNAKQINDPNIEGFVLQYWTNKAPVPFRLKIKTEDYTRLHKIITGLNPKGIWEHLAAGADPDRLWVPASSNTEFTRWCTGWIHQYQNMYKSLEDEAIRTYGLCCMQVRRNKVIETGGHFDDMPKRKEYALAFTEASQRLAPILFAMLDGKDYKPIIWKMLKPVIHDGETFIRDADTNNGI